MPDDSEQQFDPDDPIVAALKRYGIPVTRENYIGLPYGEPPEEWGAELEADLPEELQDQSWFDGKSRQLRKKVARGKPPNRGKGPRR